MTTRPKESWVETDNADDAAATATRAAVANQSHFITGVSASFSAAKAGLLLLLKEGSVEKMRWSVTNDFSEDFSSPVTLKAGDAANLVLVASGTGGVIGSVNLKGYTL